MTASEYAREIIAKYVYELTPLDRRLSERVADAILADPAIAVVELPDTYDNQLFDSITTSTAAEVDDVRGVIYLWDDLDPPDEGPSAYGPSVIRTAAAALLAAARKADQ